MERNKPIFLEFIKIYKSNSCLWNPKDPNYKNQMVKRAAYEQLLTVMKKFDPSNPENNTEAVKRKINSMRATFRRDYRKVRQSGNKYKPQLWYYDHLMFVKNYCMKDDEKSGKKKEDETSESEFTLLEILAEDDKTENIQDEIFETTEDEIEEHLEETYYTPETPSGSSTLAETKNIYVHPSSTENEDECSTFGKHIAFELQQMSERQRIIAKKLFSDVAYYGRLERLTEFTEISSTKKPE